MIKILIIKIKMFRQLFNRLKQNGKSVVIGASGVIIGANLSSISSILMIDYGTKGIVCVENEVYKYYQKFKSIVFN